VVGVDYDANAVQFAAEKCQCTTYGCGIDEAGLPPESFDIAGAIHTMEHVEDPIGFAAMIKKYLKPDGYIFIEIPNLHDPLIRLYDNAAYQAFWFQDVHLFYFTPRAFQTVMQRAGFEGQIYFWQDYNLLNHLHWILRGEPQSNCHAGLGPAALPITGQVSSDLRDELQQWIQQVDREYKSLLAKYGITGNMMFIGKRSAG
jgi:SAM-dependent methyltransferase